MRTRKSNRPGDRSLSRLRDLADTPDEQRAFAAELVAKNRDLGVVRAALGVLAGQADPAIRPVLLRRYAKCESDPSRHDPGCFLRVPILNALRPIALRDEIPLLLRAVETLEFLPPGPVEVASGLRAAAIVILNEVDETLAGFHATRLLRDEGTSLLSGEPAVSSAQVLASQSNLLPLYDYVLYEHAHQPSRVGDVLAECLRLLTPLPTDLVTPLAERFFTSEDEIVLLGLLDLLLNHPAHEVFLDSVLAFLSSTDLLNIYRYGVTTLIASRRAIEALSAMCAAERNPEKASILSQALELAR
jgi:hypothetical protein